jgi:hypothetical protein
MIKFVSSTGSIQNTIDEPKDKSGDSAIEMGNIRFLKKKERMIDKQDGVENMLSD